MTYLRSTKMKFVLTGLLLAVFLIAAVVFSVPAIPTLAAPQMGDGVNHSEFEQLQGEFAAAPEVTAACLTCHKNVGDDVLMSTHWTWEYETEDGQTLGKNNVINNYCIAVPSNEARCTSCHIGYGYRDDTFDFTDPGNIDCLVCHDTTGTYKKFPTAAGFPVSEETLFAPNGKTYLVPDYNLIAQNIGLPTRSNCGTCHFSGGGGPGVKHGDLDPSMVNPSGELDVHMGVDAGNFACQECHVTEDHQVSGSRYEWTVGESENNLKTCNSCHTTEPHEEEALNSHMDRIACQTCHIPTYAREFQSKMWWDWTTAGLKNDEGKPFQTKDEENGWVTYDSKKGDFIWEIDVVPTYEWYNGDSTWITLDDTVSADELAYINELHGDINDAGALIFPVKEFTGTQPYDAGTDTLAIPHLFPNASDKENPTAYWKAWDWVKALTTGQASVGREFSGEVGYVDTVMYWPLTHQIAPADNALQCESCHTAEGGRLDFAALGYAAEDVERLVVFPPVTKAEVEAAAAAAAESAAATEQAEADAAAAAEAAAEEAAAEEAAAEEEAAAKQQRLITWVVVAFVAVIVIGFFAFRKKA